MTRCKEVPGPQNHRRNLVVVVVAGVVVVAVAAGVVVVVVAGVVVVVVVVVVVAGVVVVVVVVVVVTAISVNIAVNWTGGGCPRVSANGILHVISTVSAWFLCAFWWSEVFSPASSAAIHSRLCPLEALKPCRALRSRVRGLELRYTAFGIKPQNKNNRFGQVLTQMHPRRCAWMGGGGLQVCAVPLGQQKTGLLEPNESAGTR